MSLRVVDMDGFAAHTRSLAKLKWGSQAGWRLAPPSAKSRWAEPSMPDVRYEALCYAGMDALGRAAGGGPMPRHPLRNSIRLSLCWRHYGE